MVTADDGLSQTTDSTQRTDEIGHPVQHRFTNLIPDSQCNHCHHAHLNQALLSQGVSEPSNPDGDRAIGGVNRGTEENASAVVWERENYVPDEGGDGYSLYGREFPYYLSRSNADEAFDDTNGDLHTTLGLGCIDCHTMTELHGGDHMVVRREFETRVRCQSCHGEADEAISAGQLPFVLAQTQVGGNAPNSQIISFDSSDEEFYLVGKLDRDRHLLRQIANSVDDSNPRYNPRTLMGCGLHSGSAAFREHLAELVRDADREEVAVQFPGLPPEGSLPDDVGERDGRLECFTCHNSWTPNCYGCHVVRDDRDVAENRLSGELEAGRFTSYGMSVVTDALALGFNTRGRVSPMVGTNIFFTHIDDQGEVVIDAEALRTVDGFSGDGNQHHPVHHHTVRYTPRDCQECHPRADDVAGDTEVLARAVGFGTDRYVFVDGEGRRHMLDRLVALDFDGDGEWDDPADGLPDGPALTGESIATTTHLPISDEAAELGPGPLDVETINRVLLNRVVPQRADF